MSGAWDRGSTRAWRTLRAAVLRRDAGLGYRCRAHEDGWCARADRPGAHRCIGQPTHAHHTLGRAATGDNPQHIVSSCEPCNLHIGQPRTHGDPPCTPVTTWTT